MTSSINHSFNPSWEIVKFCAPVLILPLPCSDTLACHTLYTLTYKVQERVFRYFFSTRVDRLSEAPSSILPSRFKTLNNTLSTALSFLILHQTGKTALARTMLIYRLYMATIFPILLISASIILVISIELYSKAKSYLYSIDMPKILITQENLEKAATIKDLIKKIEKENPSLDIDLELRKRCPALEEQVSQEIASLPIREKENPIHFWDEETIKSLIKAAKQSARPPKCPNGCDIELKLEEKISTDLQNKIIEFLTNLYSEIQSNPV